MEILSVPWTEPKKDLIKRFCYLGIKGLPIVFGDNVGFRYEKSLPQKELLDAIWALIEATKEAVSQLTPNEFMTIFPVEKRYDGDRYGVKDYFYTMEELRKIGMDTLIGGHVDTLLFDYQNPHVREFNKFIFRVIDCFRAHNGEPSIMESFMAENGISPRHLVTDKDGKQFLYDPARQTCYPLAKNRPRYLRVIK